MTETEIKLAVEEQAGVRRRLRKLGWRVAGRRHHEANIVYDRADGSLLAAGYLLRVRQVGKRCWLTVKLPGQQSTIHKVREEFEIETRNSSALANILEALGFRPAWRYEKFRTEFHRPGEGGKILLDQTPIGDFLELEGEPSWIDRTATRLGFSESDYLTATYRILFTEYRRVNKTSGRDMVF